MGTVNFNQLRILGLTDNYKKINTSLIDSMISTQMYILLIITYNLNINIFKSQIKNVFN